MENISKADLQKHKKVLKECLFLPFRVAMMPNNQKNIPVFYSLLSCHVDITNSHTMKYKLNLKYGKNTWSLSRHIIDVGRFINLLRKNKFKFIKYGGVGNIVGADFYNKFNQVIKNCLDEMIISNYLNVARMFGLSRYSFIGTRIYEEIFGVNISNISENNTFLYLFKKPKTKVKTHVILKKECIIFSDDFINQSISFVFMFDGNTKITCKNKIFGKEVQIRDLKKVIRISSKHTKRMNDLYENLLEILRVSSHKNINRFDSFAPERNNVPVKFLIDGQKYFSSLYKSINSAKKSIFIAGWWVFPKLYLRRVMENDKPNKKYRLDVLLKNKAKEGVKIYILLYREFEMALPNNSAYSEKVFLSLHRNIQVIRHPVFFNEGVLFWSHHEKIVIVDDKHSYIGGLDICLGRFDTSHHRIFDEQMIKNEQNAFIKQNEGRIKDKKLLITEDKDIEFWPGNDFSNPLIKDFAYVGLSERSLIDRNLVPRLPWHDVHCYVGKHGAFDIARHFIERWNYTRHNVNDPKIDYLLPYGEIIDEKCEEDNENYKAKIQILRSIGHWSNKYVTERSIYHAYAKLIKEAKRYIYIENQFFITRFNKKAKIPENDLGRIIFERILQAEKDKEDFKIYILIPLLPAFEAELNSPNSSIQEIIKIQSETICKNSNSLFQMLKKEGIAPEKYVLFLSLRKGIVTKERVASELIYIHSKIIITDCDKCLIGSANFNDRSMMGDRDSETAILIENCTNFVSDLQKKLLDEHLGIKTKKEVKFFNKEEEELDKFILSAFSSEKWQNLNSDEIFFSIKKKAELNTRLFKQIYRVIPDNEIRTKNEIKNFSLIPPLCKTITEFEELKNIYKRIRGHLVIYPIYFFIDEKTETGVFQISGFIPSIIYY